ncbi:hypothetical protein [Rhizobium sp. LC145]|jgi:predicted transcriptional regulator|uniref:hypothetical protein n=1 Tax=Rhizobium sp. LC145 TaxID=1120688 RepID=UPI00062A3B6A|nr:hypothetical protein [Rhizobium sp. LC145]KKX25366.1 hypothetical protein YH62_25875 [Rhizobium sp. LC145]TKT46682.1 hypothetical protein FDR95_20935 [Rhizobiaceae bacterium LC148]
MGLHKLEIELTDELLSRIDRVSTQTNHTRTEVVIETLKDHLPEEVGSKQITKEERLEALQRAWKLVSKLEPGRSQAEIDKQIREFREDRKYD